MGCLKTGEHSTNNPFVRESDLPCRRQAHLLPSFGLLCPRRTLIYPSADGYSFQGGRVTLCAQYEALLLMLLRRAGLSRCSLPDGEDSLFR